MSLFSTEVKSTRDANHTSTITSPGWTHSDDVISQSFLYLAGEDVTTGTETFSLLYVRLQRLATESAEKCMMSLITCSQLENS